MQGKVLCSSLTARLDVCGLWKHALPADLDSRPAADLVFCIMYAASACIVQQQDECHFATVLTICVCTGRA